MSNPDAIAFWDQLSGRVKTEFVAVQPLLPTYAHIILAAVFPIYAAAFASLSRPASAAAPKSKSKFRGSSREPDASEDEDDAEDAEPDNSRMEGLSPSDAIVFPLMAGLALTTLYFLLKWNKELLNKLLNLYMSLGGLFGVVKFLSDSMHFIHSLLFPTYYANQGCIWRVDQRLRKAYQFDAEPLSVNSDLVSKSTRLSPLPGVFSKLTLPTSLYDLLWTVRSFKSNDWTLKFYLSRVFIARTRYNHYHLVAYFLGTIVVTVFTFVTKPWYLTNLMGFAFSYTAMQLISPTTFTTGSLVLAGLFFYDIYMVFYTPMMVTVARNLDLPIKLLFPKSPLPGDPAQAQQFSMLGLGDVVLPGIMMGLALRFDLYLHYLSQHKSTRSVNSATTASDRTSIGNPPKSLPTYVSPSKWWSDHFWTTSLFKGNAQKSDRLPETGWFSKVYFNASLVGYISGMSVTLAVMQLSNHPQPALLYLVPGVLSSLWLTALLRGEAKLMWTFTEEENSSKEDNKDDEASDNKSKEEKEAHKKAEDEKAVAKMEAMKAKFMPHLTNEVLFFSMSHNRASNDCKTIGWVPNQSNESRNDFGKSKSRKNRHKIA